MSVVLFGLFGLSGFFCCVCVGVVSVVFWCRGAVLLGLDLVGLFFYFWVVVVVLVFLLSVCFWGFCLFFVWLVFWFVCRFVCGVVFGVLIGCVWVVFWALVVCGGGLVGVLVFFCFFCFGCRFGFFGCVVFLVCVLLWCDVFFLVWGFCVVWLVRLFFDAVSFVRGFSGVSWVCCLCCLEVFFVGFLLVLISRSFVWVAVWLAACSRFFLWCVALWFMSMVRLLCSVFWLCLWRSCVCGGRGGCELSVLPFEAWLSVMGLDNFRVVGGARF